MRVSTNDHAWGRGVHHSPPPPFIKFDWASKRQKVSAANFDSKGVWSSFNVWWRGSPSAYTHIFFIRRLGAKTLVSARSIFFRIRSYMSQNRKWFLSWFLRFIATARHCLEECDCFFGPGDWAGCPECFVKLRSVKHGSELSMNWNQTHKQLINF